MTAKAVTVRDYVDVDESGVIDLARQLQTHELAYYDRMKPVADIGEAYVAELRADVEKHRGRFLVAERAGKLVGYCTLLTHCDSSDEHDEIHFSYSYIGDLAVDKATRSQGVGAQLIATCEAVARDAGQKWLRLSVMAANTKARKFYATNGFSEHLIRLEKPL
ncbi:MAG: GNAT family N-acetyltransferase [Phyllobacteriaceae bacterium]|jgi:ribosomal protein S18 acetylase RimI-like enzyme|nr:GNAT family N-acetyltransferase [Phyllobacteriaceae bacterium]